MELLIENVINVGADEFYRASRYKIPLSVVFINTKNKKAFNILEKNIRQIDIVQQLSSQTIVLFLLHTDTHSAELVIRKLKDIFTFTYTMREFNSSEHTFIEALALENMQKLD